jgi:hypothetical protein
MKTRNILIYESVWNVIPKLNDSQLGEYFRAIADWRLGNEIVITDFAVELLFSQYIPHLEKQEKDYGQKLDASKKGVEVRKKKSTQSSTDNQPITERLPSDNQPTTKRLPIEVEVEVEKEEDKEVEVEVETTTLKSYTFVEEKISEDDLELFTIMFAEFGESDSMYDELFDMWIKLPFNEQDDSIRYTKNFINYQTSRKKKASLFFYLKDKKYNWTTIRK